MIWHSLFFLYANMFRSQFQPLIGLPWDTLYALCGMFSKRRVGVVVRAVAFHQCVPGSIPGPTVICGLSSLVLYSVPRGFSPVLRISPLTKNQHLNLFCCDSIWFGRTREKSLNRPPWVNDLPAFQVIYLFYSALPQYTKLVSYAKELV